VTDERESEIYIRVVPTPGREGDLGGPPLFERFEQRVDELGASIGNIARRLRTRLDSELDDPQSPVWNLDEVSLSFSLDLEAEAGVVVAKAKTHAGFEVNLKWARNGKGE
jgi:hypothetical protein